MKTQNKIALVTGGSRGLGKEMALRIAEKGIDVVLTYNTGKDEAMAVVKEIQQMGRHAAALSLNVEQIKTLDTFVSNFANTLQETFQSEKFDYLVNNAGMNFVIPSFAATTEEQFDQLLNIHYKSVFFLTQKLLPHLNDEGGIVNLSTALTRTTFPGSGTYASMKGAVEILTKFLAKELGARGINVNVVAPGAVPTDFSGGRLKNSPQMQEHIKAATAIPRLARPEDIGGLVAFLCTPDSKWVTGQRIEVSGGLQI